MLSETEKMIYKLYITLAKENTYSSWVNIKVPAFNMKSARELIDEGKGQEVIDVLEKLMRGGYM